MFLKRMEMKGFKSFADPLHIEIEPGITVVVGPNGSGKSNIADGIRWVLGEQSAKSLRGSKMADVIFAGSDERRRVNMAEVTLVLDNESGFLPLSYTEISLTRRLYRSGESEYLLNRQPCRRKDIIDVMMDSGLGREAYSIIGQGQVEQVLSSKPEDRRVIFEEAAGVVKYQSRKRESERKLADTNDNLARVQDILHELEQQLEPLEIQAAEARDYKAKKAELENVAIALTVYDIEEAHKRWSELKTKAASLEKAKQTAEMNVSELESEAERVRVKLAEVSEALAAARSRRMTAGESLEKQEGQKELLEERSRHAAERLEELEKRQSELSSAVSEADEHLKAETKKLKEKEAELEQLETERKTVAGELQGGNRNVGEELEKLKADYIEALNEQAARRNELNSLAEQKSRAQAKLDRLFQENEAWLKERDEAEAAVNETKAALSHQEAELEQAKTDLAEQENAQNRMNRELETDESKLYEAYGHIQEARSKKHVLDEMETAYTGFYQGPKEILKARERLSGVYGAVIEKLQVPKQYETAVETALGAAQQNIIVDTEQNARKAIQLLKSEKKGRATFLPLESVQAKSASIDVTERLTRDEGYHGTADQLVTTEQQFQPVIASLLGRTFIASDLESANRIAKISSYKYRVITLDGDIVAPGGAMTGGSQKQGGAQLLSRQREREELAEKIKHMEQKTATFEAQVQEKKEKRRELEEKRKQLESSLEASREAAETMRQKYEKAKQHQAHLASRMQLFEREKAQLESEMADFDERKETAAAEAASLETSLQALQKEMDQLENEQQARQSKSESLKEKQNDLDVRRAAAREQTAYQKERVRELKQDMQENERLKTEVDQELNDLKARVTEVQGGSSTLQGDVESARAEKEAAAAELEAKQQEETEMKKQQADVNARLKAAQTKLQETSNEHHEVEVSLTRIDVELDQKLNELSEEYNLTFERAKAAYELHVSEAEAREQVKLIRRSLEELGEVNLGSIEEYERVKARAEFLQGQQEDLLEARDTLQSVIQEMDEEMTRRFQETFHEVRTHFRSVFQELFGGGEADLTLTNEIDLLDTGVEIEARPPGKKKQVLSLLSGGEKAMTAIALLFAILRVKPVPFCVLDEVEAALDEANLTRFAGYLKRMKHDTQFIVVSHRKATMEEADALYGITMEESGVSRAISVKIDEASGYTTPQAETVE
ncbi:condensin subunit Smc [Salsuginibacillus halophilus]|uniref:Chromosome partition protein Smc n=1 Tax=Salsuginibacillus halophilus TaxID=517424 RepID=A0A2P8HY43_9BACI|nr:chromosome segregation protein SMC [Salsuginibacillus halophilus]PSL51161.1 condensin subunit Smc [Salsuginibacillus halophilus]